MARLQIITVYRLGRHIRLQCLELSNSMLEEHIMAKKRHSINLLITYNNSGKSSYANFEIGPDLNKPYVQVVKQQVKMQHDDLHEILVKLHIKFI